MLRSLAVSMIFLSLAVGGATAAESTSEQGRLLSLQEALVRGLERNFDLQAERLNIPSSHEDVTTEAARFDPVADAAVSGAGERTPTASDSFDDAYARLRRYGAEAGLGKAFQTGLDARLALETSQLDSNEVGGEGTLPKKAGEKKNDE